MNLAWWNEHPSELPLLLLTAVVTHLLMSFSQTLMHYRLGHRRLGGIFFRNHIHYHHVNYSKDHLVSLVYIKNDSDGNNTPFFLIPVALMVLATYFIFPIGVFLIQIITAFASFSAHVYLDNQFHIAGSPLLRFAWFRRKQQLHFVHHKHANSNFAVIDNFWDRLLGTYRNPDADDAGNPPPESRGEGREGSNALYGLFLGASLRDRAKPDDNARYLAQWQAEVRVVMEKSAHRHTWIASITRILHYCEAAGLFDSNEPFCPVATATRQYDSDYA